MKKKAEVRAKRAEERAQRTTDRQKGNRTKRTVQKKGVTSSDSAGPSTKKRRYEDSTEIDTDVCCMCFGNYGDDVLEGEGVEWIACACGRWLHVDCAETHVIDVNGCERFCPYCIC